MPDRLLKLFTATVNRKCETMSLPTGPFPVRNQAGFMHTASLLWGSWVFR